MQAVEQLKELLIEAMNRDEEKEEHSERHYRRKRNDAALAESRFTHKTRPLHISKRILAQ
jgi:hypothetical protein